jgi:CHASE2 domain-containing sensor protein
MRPRATSRTRTIALGTAALVAVLGSVVPFALHAWPRVENDTLDARFAVRGSTGAPSDVVAVEYDDPTFNLLKHQWPFPRRWDARVIDILKADGARVIAYDLQFTEATDPKDDYALYGAVKAARNVVLATTEVSTPGQTNVLGGNASVRGAHAVVAAANLPDPEDGVVRRYAYSLLGLPSFAVATARLAGHPINRSSFDDNTALIDFRGPPNTIRHVSFADVYEGLVAPSTFAGKVVVIGASAPTLQDLHQTSTTSNQPMAGVEVQANAIWTAMHGNPLGDAPWWLTVIAILLCALVAPITRLRLSVSRTSGVAIGVLAVYLLITQLAFDAGLALTVSYPIVAGLLGTVGMLVASYVVAMSERNAFSARLAESQLELIQRLARAVESRDTETGEHTARISKLCHTLALELGWSAADARTLMHASIAHDIGKIGIPDHILRKPGPLDPEEWEIMRAHTTIGAEMLAGSSSPLVQMAESVARSHHERWDGSGYPDGLAGDQIPIGARICSVADVYDALVSRRPYKNAWRREDAVREIQRTAGAQFDPAIVAAFMRLIPNMEPSPTGSQTPERVPIAGVNTGDATPVLTRIRPS